MNVYYILNTCEVIIDIKVRFDDIVLCIFSNDGPQSVIPGSTIFCNESLATICYLRVKLYFKYLKNQYNVHISLFYFGLYLQELYITYLNFIMHF